MAADNELRAKIEALRVMDDGSDTANGWNCAIERALSLIPAEAPAPADRTTGQDETVADALAELGELVRCRCHPAYKDRKMHDPECHCDSAEAVSVLAAEVARLTAERDALRARIAEQQGDGTLMTPDQRQAWDAAFRRVFAVLDAADNSTSDQKTAL